MTTDLFKRASFTALVSLVALAAASATLAPAAAFAHGSAIGDIAIGHPYALPSVPGASNGLAFIANLENTGKTPDRLLLVSTPVAARAEIHTMSMDPQGVMRMKEVGEIAVAPGAPIKMHPGDGLHFMLMGLKQPLKQGDSFPMTMKFERAGEVEVKVVVQAPKTGGEGEHKH